MKFEWFIASRYLKSRREQSFISIIGVISVISVALGIAVVILVISVMNGFEHGLKEKFLANEAHVTVRSAAGNYFSNYQETLKQIEAIDGVEATSPVIYTPIAVWPKDKSSIDRTIFVKGIDPEKEDQVTRFSKFFDGSVDFKNSPLIESARLKGDETISGGIVLGDAVANHMGALKGDVLRLISRMEQNPSNPTAFWAHIRNFVVVGIYKSGMYTYDNHLGFIHLDAAQELYNRPDEINMIEVRTSSAEIASEVRQEIASTVRLNGGIRGIPIANTWVDTHAPLFEAIKLEKIVTVIIEALIILVAAFNIASTLIMTVMEKTRDIGVLRAMGSSKHNILKIFMVQGCTIGVLGGILGTVLGVSISWLLDQVEYDRPSRWFALLILIPICIQFFIAFRRSLALHFSFKGLLGLLWIGTIGLFLYCLAQPIYIDGQVYQLSRLPVKINWLFVGFMNVLSFAICWLATVYPAWQASKLNPVEALRYE
jgi:lipoprotein-releasing system permease protein